MLTRGDVIVAGNGYRWQVDRIYTNGKRRQRAYDLIGLFDGLPRMKIARHELVQWFSGCKKG